MGEFGYRHNGSNDIELDYGDQLSYMMGIEYEPRISGLTFTGRLVGFYQFKSALMDFDMNDSLLTTDLLVGARYLPTSYGGGHLNIYLPLYTRYDPDSGIDGPGRSITVDVGVDAAF